MIFENDTVLNFDSIIFEINNNEEIDKKNISKLSDLPLPKYYFFPEIINFIIPIKYIGYKDNRFARKNLIPHYLQLIKLIENWYKELQEILISIENQLNRTYKKKLIPFISTINNENSILWRNRVILTWKRSKLLKIFLLKKYNNILNSLNIYKKILKTLNYLIKFPRPFAFNKAKIFDLLRHIKEESSLNLQKKIKIIKTKLHFIKEAWIFTKYPFNNIEQSSNYLNILFDRAYKNYIQFPGYLSECEEFYIFQEFLDSRISPIRYKDQIPMTELIPRIQWTFEMILSLTGKKTLSQSIILHSFIMRFWFNEMKVFDNYLINSNNLILDQKLFEIRISKINLFNLDFIFPKKNETVNEAFNRKFFAALKEQFILCWFQSTPFDAAFIIYTVVIQLESFIKTGFTYKCGIPSKSTILNIMLKLLLAAVDMPSPDLIFKNILIFHDLQLFNDNLVNPTKLFYNVIKNL